jgi:hypothetical protein
MDLLYKSKGMVLELRLLFYEFTYTNNAVVGIFHNLCESRVKI